jgi:hypothetical protein
MQYAFGSEKAIDDHFKRTQQDDTETPENQGMKKTNQRFAKDPGLSECNGEHDFESFRKIPYRECRFCKQEKPDDTVGGIGEYTQCDE